MVHGSPPHSSQIASSLAALRPTSSGSRHDRLAVAELNAALLHDGVDRPAQVLVQPHASGDAVHDDADWWMFFVLISSHFRFLRALRVRACGQRRRFDAGARQRAVEFLPPVGHVARRAVAVDHAQRRVAGIGQLMKDLRRDVDGLPGRHVDALFAQAHLARAFDDEVDLLLLLVVPRHLAAVRLERDVAHREIGGLNGARAADQVLRAPARRIRSPGNLRKIGNDHGSFLQKVKYGDFDSDEEDTAPARGHDSRPTWTLRRRESLFPAECDPSRWAGDRRNAESVPDA